MPSIEIHRRHDKPLKEAKAAVQRVADKLAEKFEVDWEWQGNTLVFERSGVHGEIALAKGEVQITAHLGFLLMALRGPIETEIHRYLDREFA